MRRRRGHHAQSQCTIGALIELIRYPKWRVYACLPTRLAAVYPPPRVALPALPPTQNRADAFFVRILKQQAPLAVDVHPVCANGYNF